MSGLTQMEFGLACISAGLILLVIRYWRFFFLFFVGIILAILWEEGE